MALENVMRVDNGKVIGGGMPETYPATQVMMSDGVTSVEEAVDEVMERVDAHNVSGGTRVDIKDYTTQNPYVCPCDGYVRLDGSSGVTAYIAVNGANITGGTFTHNESFGILVRKGMSVSHDVNATGAFTLYFYPFE